MFGGFWPPKMTVALVVIDRIEETTAGVVGQGFHPPKHFTLGMSNLVREEEG
jgi:hypothetical protein